MLDSGEWKPSELRGFLTDGTVFILFIAFPSSYEVDDLFFFPNIHELGIEFFKGTVTFPCRGLTVACVEKIQWNDESIPISRASKGNENYFEKSGVRNIGGKITVKQIQGKQLLVRAVSRSLRNRRFEKSGFHWQPKICSKSTKNRRGTKIMLQRGLIRIKRAF